MQRGCAICGLENRRQKPFNKTKVSKERLLSGKWVVLPEPYNCYRVKFNKGKRRNMWTVESKYGPLKLRKNDNGYLDLTLCTTNIGEGQNFKPILLHRLIYALAKDISFLNKFEFDKTVDHEDRDRMNNHPDNLRPATHYEQNLNASYSKIKPKHVRKILHKYSTGISIRNIAKRYKVSRATIYLIVQSKAHIPSAINGLTIMSKKL